MRIVPKLAASAAVALSLSAAVSAQNLSQSFVPQLVIAAPAERPVALRGVAIRTEISGSLALTSVELTFFNPNRAPARRRVAVPAAGRPERRQHGDGHRRQAARGGAGREGARAGGVRGRDARADRPRLLSVTQGNNYKLRVYPILPQRDKVVVLRYAETLAARNGKQVYRLPLHYAAQLPQLSLAVRVTGSATPPLVARGDIDLPGFERAGDAYVLNVSRRDFRGQRHARARRPRGARPASLHADRRRNDLLPRRSAGRRAQGAARVAAQRHARVGQLGIGPHARPRAANSRCSTRTSRRRATSTFASCACATPPSRHLR